MSVTAINRTDRPEDALAHLSERLSEPGTRAVLVYVVQDQEGGEPRIRGVLCGDMTDAELALIALLNQRWALEGS